MPHATVVAGVLLVLCTAGLRGASGELLAAEVSLGPRTTEPDLTSTKDVVHVSQPTGSDTTGDGTRTKPLATLAGALARIRNAGADHPCAILVAAGTYGGTTV